MLFSKKKNGTTLERYYTYKMLLIIYVKTYKLAQLDINR